MVTKIKRIEPRKTGRQKEMKKTLAVVMAGGKGERLMPGVLKTHRVMAYPYHLENKIWDIIAYTDTKGIRREKMVNSIRDSAYWGWGPWIHTGMPTWT